MKEWRGRKPLKLPLVILCPWCQPIEDPELERKVEVSAIQTKGPSEAGTRMTFCPQCSRKFLVCLISEEYDGWNKTLKEYEDGCQKEMEKVWIMGRRTRLMVVCHSVTEVRDLFEGLEREGSNGRTAPARISMDDDQEGEEETEEDDEGGSENGSVHRHRRQGSPVIQGLKIIGHNPQGIDAGSLAGQMSFGDPRGLGPWRHTVKRRLKPYSIDIGDVLSVEVTHVGRKRVKMYRPGGRLAEALSKLGGAER